MLTKMNNFKLNFWNRLSQLDVNEESGTEAIEWVAMVAILLLFLVVVGTSISGQGGNVGNAIISAIVSWIDVFTL